MVDIRHTGRCAAPLDVAFAYLNDYRMATDWMFGLTDFRPLTDRTSGLGARYEGTFAVRPVRLSATIEITEWVENEVISFVSIKGFHIWSTWRFAGESPTSTRIDVVLSYELPGGLAGRVLGRALEPIVALTVRHSDTALRREIEAG